MAEQRLLLAYGTPAWRSTAWDVVLHTPLPEKLGVPGIWVEAARCTLHATTAAERDKITSLAALLCKTTCDFVFFGEGWLSNVDTSKIENLTHAAYVAGMCVFEEDRVARVIGRATTPEELEMVRRSMSVPTFFDDGAKLAFAHAAAAGNSGLARMLAAYADVSYFYLFNSVPVRQIILDSNNADMVELLGRRELLEPPILYGDNTYLSPLCYAVVRRLAVTFDVLRRLHRTLVLRADYMALFRRALVIAPAMCPLIGQELTPEQQGDLVISALASYPFIRDLSGVEGVYNELPPYHPLRAQIAFACGHHYPQLVETMLDDTSIASFDLSFVSPSLSDALVVRGRSARDPRRYAQVVARARPKLLLFLMMARRRRRAPLPPPEIWRLVGCDYFGCEPE